jgi:predicted ATPase/class 3 adenylate cyclase
VARRPTGTVTFLFADIEGSTELLQQVGDAAYGRLLARYRTLMRRCCVRHGGYPVDALGDAFFAVFGAAHSAVAAAVAMQRSLLHQRWPRRATVRARIGLHTGTAVATPRGYVGVDVHRAARIGAAGHGGQVLLSEATAVLVADRLPAGASLQEVGVFRLRGLRLPEHLYQLQHPRAPPDLPPPRAWTAPLHNLPLPLTTFVGRDGVLAQVTSALAGSRLVTLTGPGGVGKTRVALEVARTLLPRFADGAWLVDLAPVMDPSLVPAAVAAVLRVREEPGRPLAATLADALRDRSVLLVLDNCERAVSACAWLADTLLRASAGVVILATSRQRLGVAGEVSLPVPPLAVPDIGEVRSDVAGRAEAVRLFMERVQAALPGFVVTNAVVADAVRIVRALDGLPLAIELAAAQVPALPLSELADRLADRFRLVMAAGSVPARHHTLQAALDWSYELLDEGQRRLLRRLAVFAGGFTLEAAEAVCAWGDLGLSDVVSLLVQLVNRSWVLVAGGRYSLLDTVRHYARERLREAGEDDAAEGVYVRVFRDLAERAQEGLRGPQQRQWLQVLDAEAANLAAALAAALRRAPSAEDAVRMAAALWLYWYIRGYWKEGRALLEDALAGGGAVAARWRARALQALAHLSSVLGDAPGADTMARDSLRMCREADDTFGEACALLVLGTLARRSGRGDEAVELLQRSLALFRQMGDLWGTAWALRLLAIVRWFRGEADSAVRLFEDSLDLSRLQGNTVNQAAALHGLGRIAVYVGDLPRAEALLREGLLQFLDLGDREGIASSLLMLGQVASARGAHRRAVQLVAAAGTLRRAIGEPPTPEEGAQVLAAARAAVGDRPTDVAWTEGCTLTLDDAAAAALES